MSPTSSQPKGEGFIQACWVSAGQTRPAALVFSGCHLCTWGWLEWRTRVFL